MPSFKKWLLLLRKKGKKAVADSPTVVKKTAVAPKAEALDLEGVMADQTAGDWEMPPDAKGFNMDDAKFATISLTVLDTKKLACHGISVMLINCLKTQLQALATMIDVIRKNKRYLTHHRAHGMYDWIEVMQDRYVRPLLDCIVQDILPALGKEVNIPPESSVYVENRLATLEQIKADMDAILRTSFALTPRLPSGERVFVLVYSYTQFETHMLKFLADVESAIPKRVPSKSVAKEFEELERNVWDILVLNAGMTKVNGKMEYNDDRAQEMRGVLCNWMGDDEMKSLRSRLGIRAIEVGRISQLARAHDDYKATVHGGFIESWKAAFQSDAEENKKVLEMNAADPSLTLALNTMAGQRLMKDINDGVNLDDYALEEITGEVDNGENAAVLFYGTAKPVVDVSN
jgi:hypothetical protein